MEKVLESVKVYVNVEADSIDQKNAYSFIAHSLSNCVLNITELISLMEKPLTTTDDKERFRATLLLAELLTEHVMSNSTVIHHVITFLNNRLSDYPSIVPALQGLNSIITAHSSHIDSKYNDINNIFSNIFEKLQVQSLAQTIRQRIFILFESMLILPSHLLLSFDSNGNDILEGILTALEGEKDPRCLLIALRVLNHCFKALSTHVEMHAERIFDNTSCYFPITFTPPPDDPYGITADMLIIALQDILCKHRSMLQYSIPFLIDQLSSDSTVAKLHAITSFGYICQLHSTTVIHSNLEYLAEILYEHAVSSSSIEPPSSTSTSISSRSTWTICEISQQIYIQKQHSSEISKQWYSFMNPILRQIKQEISNNLDSILATSAIRLCCEIGKRSYFAVNFLIQELYPDLLNKSINGMRIDTVCDVRALLGLNTSTNITNQSGRTVSVSVPVSTNTNTNTNTTSIKILSKLVRCLDPTVDYSSLTTGTTISETMSGTTAGTTSSSSSSLCSPVDLLSPLIQVFYAFLTLSEENMLMMEGVHTEGDNQNGRYGNNSSNDNTVVDLKKVSESVENYVKVYIVVMDGMRDVLTRCPLSITIDVQNILSIIIRIAIHGLYGLLLEQNKDDNNNNIDNNKTKCVTESMKELLDNRSEGLRLSAISLLIDLIQQARYHSIISTSFQRCLDISSRLVSSLRGTSSKVDIHNHISFIDPIIQQILSIVIQDVTTSPASSTSNSTSIPAILVHENTNAVEVDYSMTLCHMALSAILNLLVEDPSSSIKDSSTPTALAVAGNQTVTSDREKLTVLHFCGLCNNINNNEEETEQQKGFLSSPLIQILNKALEWGMT
eukprot:gene4859-9684_t